jgi:hypothetical protein
MLVQMIDRSNYKNEIQWIMVMDDDTFVSPPNLESLVSEYNSQSNNFHPLLNSVNQCLESPKGINSFHYVS